MRKKKKSDIEEFIALPDSEKERILSAIREHDAGGDACQLKPSQCPGTAAMAAVQSKSATPREFFSRQS